MEENDKKRKVKLTPPESKKKKLIRKSKRIAKRSEKPPIFDCSSSEEERNRTPSGTLINSKVSDIRNYFDQGAELSRSKAMFKNSQEDDKLTQAEHLQSVSVNALNTSSASVTSKQNINTSDHDQSKVSEDNKSQAACSSNKLTSEDERSEQTQTDEEKETAFLHVLAKMLPTKHSGLSSDESSNSSINVTPKKRATSTNSASESNSNASEMEHEQTVMEKEDEVSPQSINIHTVMEMFRQLKKGQRSR